MVIVLFSLSGSTGCGFAHINNFFFFNVLGGSEALGKINTCDNIQSWHRKYLNVSVIAL